MSNVMEPNVQQRVAARNLFGCGNNVPVVFGDIPAPQLTGRAGGHFTKGGTRVRHPNAYSRKGWSNIDYKRDTRIITIPFSFNG